MKTFDIIVCHDSKNGIGKENSLPWKLSKDMLFFKKTTSETAEKNKKNIIIMGRKTWKSLPQKPLPHRYNLIVSKTLSFSEKMSKTIKSIDAAIATALKSPQFDKVFVIGGSDIFKQTITHEKRKHIYVTEIFEDFNCSVFFPSYKKNNQLIKEFSKETENNITFQRKIFRS